MKEVIILTPGPFLKRDYERFGIQLLKKNFSLKICDITAWANPELWKEYFNKVYKCEEYISITSKGDFLRLCSEKKIKLVLDFLGNNSKSNWIRKKLKSENSSFVRFDINLIPKEETGFIERLKKKNFLFKEPKKLIFNFLKSAYYSLIKEYTPDYLVLGGGSHSENKKVKNKIFAHCMDYDVYLNLKKEKKYNERPYAVFLEDNMTHDSDYSISNISPPVTEIEYFPTLIKFLKKFELNSGLKIKIAIHPKSSKNLTNLLKDFECHKENTAKIVKDSSLVLLHASTALSYAILFSKPTLFLTSNELKNSWIGPRINNLAQVVNSKLININSSLPDSSIFNNLLKLDKEKYKNYKDQYLKMPNSLEIPLWEIFIRNIENDFKNNI